MSPIVIVQLEYLRCATRGELVDSRYLVESGKAG